MKRNDPDFFPLYVGNHVLGGSGFGSRLTYEIREKKGLVYSVYSYFMPLSKKGPFEVALQTSKDQVDEAMGLIKTTIQISLIMDQANLNFRPLKIILLVDLH